MVSTVRIEDVYERPPDKVHKSVSSIRGEKTTWK